MQGDAPLWRVTCRESVGSVGRTLMAAQARESYRDRDETGGSVVIFVDTRGHRHEVPYANIICIEPNDPKDDAPPATSKGAVQLTGAQPPPAPPERAPSPPPPPAGPPAPPLVPPGVVAKGRGGKWARKDAALNIISPVAVVADPINLPTPGAKEMA